VTIVSGGATGADSLGRDVAQKHGANYLEFLPDWEKHGKSAGVIRNADLVKISDFVVAFWDGQSRGTRHSLDIARQKGTPYYVYNFVTRKEATLTEEVDPAQTVAQVLKVEAEKRFGTEALNRVVFASVPPADIPSPLAPESAPGNDNAVKSRENGVLPGFEDFNRTLDTMADRKIWSSPATREAWKQGCHKKIVMALAAGIGTEYRAELGNIAEQVFPPERWTQEVRNEWMKPYLTRMIILGAGNNENKHSMIDFCLTCARHFTTAGREDDLVKTQKALYELLNGSGRSYAEKETLVERAMRDHLADYKALVAATRAEQSGKADNKFIEAGFFAHYSGDGSPRGYRKSPLKTGDGGEVTIRVVPMAGGAFSILSEYEKNHILDGRRKHAATASSADEALAIAANFEKYLLPEAARPAEQAAPMPSLRMR
jgi:hypothetical protein